MTIWSAYISLEQVYLGLLGHFDPTLHPQVGMAPHMRFHFDHRGSADASSGQDTHSLLSASPTSGNPTSALFQLVPLNFH